MGSSVIVVLPPGFDFESGIVHRSELVDVQTFALISTVTLRRVRGKTDEIVVLQLSQQERENLELQWISPSHLEIAFKRPAEIDFQATSALGSISRNF